jgi:hypothetical protein
MGRFACYAWGNQVDNYNITWNTYSNNSNGKKVNGNIIPLPQQEDIQLSLSIREKRKRYIIAAAK